MLSAQSLAHEPLRKREAFAVSLRSAKRDSLIKVRREATMSKIKVVIKNPIVSPVMFEQYAEQISIHLKDLNDVQGTPKMGATLGSLEKSLIALKVNMDEASIRAQTKTLGLRIEIEGLLKILAESGAYECFGTILRKFESYIQGEASSISFEQMQELTLCILDILQSISDIDFPDNEESSILLVDPLVRQNLLLRILGVIDRVVDKIIAQPDMFFAEFSSIMTLGVKILNNFAASFQACRQDPSKNNLVFDLSTKLLKNAKILGREPNNSPLSLEVEEQYLVTIGNFLIAMTTEFDPSKFHSFKPTTLLHELNDKFLSALQYDMGFEDPQRLLSIGLKVLKNLSVQPPTNDSDLAEFIAAQDQEQRAYIAESYCEETDFCKPGQQSVIMEKLTRFDAMMPAHFSTSLATISNLASSGTPNFEKMMIEFGYWRSILDLNLHSEKVSNILNLLFHLPIQESKNELSIRNSVMAAEYACLPEDDLTVNDPKVIGLFVDLVSLLRQHGPSQISKRIIKLFTHYFSDLRKKTQPNTIYDLVQSIDLVQVVNEISEEAMNDERRSCSSWILKVFYLMKALSVCPDQSIDTDIVEFMNDENLICMLSEAQANGYLQELDECKLSKIEDWLKEAETQVYSSALALTHSPGQEANFAI